MTPPLSKSTLFPTRRSSDLELSPPYIYLPLGNIYTNKNKMIKKEIIYDSNINFLKGNLHDIHFTIVIRSEEHTSELQSRGHLVCRLLLEKKKKNDIIKIIVL